MGGVTTGVFARLTPSDAFFFMSRSRFSSVLGSFEEITTGARWEREMDGSDENDDGVGRGEMSGTGAEALDDDDGPARGFIGVVFSSIVLVIVDSRLSMGAVAAISGVSTVFSFPLADAWSSAAAACALRLLLILATNSADL